MKIDNQIQWFWGPFWGPFLSKKSVVCRSKSSQNCNILMRILQFSVNYCNILMRILHFHSSFWSCFGQVAFSVEICIFFCEYCNIWVRIAIFSWEYCNSHSNITIFAKEYAYFYRKSDLAKTWPKRRVKMQYSHENIAIIDWELQYSHENITILTALRPANDRLFTQKWSPKWTPKSLNLVVYFHYFFNYSSGPLFQRFCLPNAPKMAPKKVSFLRPLTLLKCSK